MWNGPLRRIDGNRFEIPRDYKGEHGDLAMRVPGIIYASDAMIEQIKKDSAPEQVANVASLPGIVGKSMAMPDIHWGYGFVIGGVAAFDANDGIISPGGIGFDINCGVRLVRTNLTVNDVKPKLKELVDTLFRNVPSGVGAHSKLRFSQQEFDALLSEGAKFIVDKGLGWREDIEHLEENGCMASADPSRVSQKAKQRGMPEIGTLGAGNHFLEIQRVDEIFEDAVAKRFGITSPDQIVVMIHTGSRGCGHQICTDYLKVLEELMHKMNVRLADRELAYAPVGTKEADDYFGAMSCGANFAWANRQAITHWVRQSFASVLGRSPEEMEMRVVYDVCHNIGKLEEHVYEGKRRKVYVHRKGATRAFGPGRSEVPQAYRDVGQPVLIPGDMGTASYVLVGTEQAMNETFGSTCHGAGRVMSRNEAIRRWRGRDIVDSLGAEGIYVHPANMMIAAEEAPDAYKDIEDVIGAVHGAGISRKVARMRPLGVVKG